jgi:hypothetical protein
MHRLWDTSFITMRNNSLLPITFHNPQRLVAWASDWNVQIQIELKSPILGGYVYIYILIVVTVVSRSDSTGTGPDSIREWRYCRSYIAEVTPVTLVIPIYVTHLNRPTPSTGRAILWNLSKVLTDRSDRASIWPASG